MAISRKAKETIKSQIAEELGKANAAIVAEYRGLTVAELSELRTQLREVDAKFKIAKNRVVKVAIKEDVPDAEGISDSMKGPVGITIVNGDVAQAAKAVLKFQKEHEKFKVSAGVMDGKKVSPEDLKAIADLPPKEVLLANIVGSLVSPHRGILGVLSGVPRQLVQVINAIKDTKAG